MTLEKFVEYMKLYNFDENRHICQEVFMDFWKDLTDQDYKVWEYIKFYNIGRQYFYLPDANHVAMKLGKSERSIMRSYARLRELKLVQN